MMEFFEQVQHFLKYGENLQKVVLIIDEFDGIPTTALKGFLHAFRHTYVTQATFQCPHSLGIVGVKNITQLDYDRSVSPFNIQDDFALSNFTLDQVQELYRTIYRRSRAGFQPRSN